MIIIHSVAIETIDNILSSVVSNVSKYQSEFNSFIIIHIDKLLNAVIVFTVEESNYYWTPITWNGKWYSRMYSI